MLGKRRLIILAVLALLAAGTVFWLESSRQPAAEMAASGPLLPMLSSRINDVDQIAISAGGERAATLQKSGDGWVMPERDNYPVDMTELRGLLVTLNEARRIEAKTANSERYGKLGVDDPLADADASGVRLDISAAGETMGLIVGSNRQGGSGTYVRPVDEAQSWLTDRNIAVEKRPAQWLQRQLTDIPASRLQSVTVTHPADGDLPADEVTVVSDGKSGFSLENLPRGRELADSYATEALAGFLAALRFDDLADAATKSIPEQGVGNAEFRSSDGLVIGLRYWIEGERPQRVWTTFTIDFDAEQAEMGVEAAQARAKAEYDAALIRARQAVAADADAVPAASAAEPVATASDAASPEAPQAISDPEADRSARLAALKTEAEAIRDRVEGRVFELPTSKASNLRKRLDAYLKPQVDD